MKMVRPKNKRRIAQCPKHRRFNKIQNGSSKPIKLNIDEFEAIRLKEYHDIKQKESAELMNISQSTFHRILNSARKKIAISLIEGKQIVIVGDDFVTDQKKYICKECGFQWSNPEKEYSSCPDCSSENIEAIENEENITPNSFRGHGRGHPDKCKCPECGYEEEKVRGMPCRNKECPNCGTPLIGRGRCCD